VAVLLSDYDPGLMKESQRRAKICVTAGNFFGDLRFCFKNDGKYKCIHCFSIYYNISINDVQWK
jgi:hypothetical protein